jgi:hypothetical protein
VNADALLRAGVSDSLVPRTLQALQTLDLIDEQGQPTGAFEAIRLAPEPEYQKSLQEWLNAAYADVILFLDPASADPTAIRDAFRVYTPIGQQGRMVSLFMGLYAAAGIGPERPSQPRPARPRAPGASGSAKAAIRKPPAGKGASGIPEPLTGLLAKLPEEGHGWTQDQRDKFLKTFGTVLDFCFPITADDEEPASE